MPNMVATNDTTGAAMALYRAEYERAAQDAAGLSPAWLRSLRRVALARFAELGFPTRRDEEWRFTNIGPIADTAFQPAGFEYGRLDAAEVAPLLFADLPAHRLVFVNGRFAAELSDVRDLPVGVTVTNLADALQAYPEQVETYLAKQAKFADHAFAALNTAFLEDGAYVHIRRNVAVETPILLVFLSNAPADPTVSYPRTLVVAEENSQATVVESYAAAGQSLYFTNAVTEIVAAENAVIDHYKLNREAHDAYHVAVTQIELARSAHFTSHSITLGGRIVRNDINAGLRGEGISCTLNGLYIARDRQLVDNHTAIDHAMPHCESHELYKGIIDDRARGVFNGKIYVRLDAQKTDAKQTNQTLLLSDTAQINTKPQLEIYADDVKCTHGATVGQLSREAIFYLRSRGIGEADARALLTYAFAADIVNRIKVEPVRAELDNALLTQLPRK
jgi:Fe-S cluster assembly protein SufD